MKNSTLILVGLIIIVTNLTPAHTESDQDEIIEGKTNSHSLLETEKGVEVSLEEKSLDEMIGLSEPRVQRSTESNADIVSISGEFKTDKDNIKLKSSTIDENFEVSSRDDVEKSQETSKFESKMSDLNDDKEADEISGERFRTNKDNEKLNDDYRVTIENPIFDDLDKNTQNEDKLSTPFITEAEEVNKKRSEDQINIPNTRRFIATQDALLDTKARMAEHSDETNDNLTNENSGLGDNAAKRFGSQRSYSGETTSPFLLPTLNRPGMILRASLIPIRNSNSLHLRDIFEHPMPRPNYFTPQSLSQKPYDTFTSPDLKPLEEFNSNLYSNAYPYAHNPTTTTTKNPLEINRFQNNPTGLLGTISQSLKNFKRPIVKYIGENLQAFPPLSFKPLKPNPSFLGLIHIYPVLDALSNIIFIIIKNVPLVYNFSLCSC